jgi:hypothetical protein
VDASPGSEWGDRAVSLDERWITREQKGTLEIRPMQGGDWKPLAELGPNGAVAFTADGNWVLYPSPDAAGKPSLFHVASTGGQPERMGDFPGKTVNVFLSVSPDGKKIIAQLVNPQSGEVSVLENFEPKQQAAK